MSNPSILRYPGGKTRAVKHILPLIPEDTTVLLSPFMGGGSIEHAWARQDPTRSVYAADYFNPVAVFWQQVARNPKAVAREVEALYPLAKEDFYMLQQKHMRTRNPVKVAAQFYVLNRASFSGATLSGGMSPGHPRFTESSVKRLRDFVMPNVAVEHADVFEWLPALLGAMDRAGQKDTTTIYLDPPYLIPNDNLYGSKGSTHRGFDHELLANMLVEASDQGWRWILSYNNSAEVKALYTGLAQSEPQWAYGMSKDKTAKELLVFSTGVLKP